MLIKYFPLTSVKDDVMCLSLSTLTTSVGLYHARHDAEFHQWVPPVVISAVLYAMYLVIFITRWQSHKLRKQASVVGVVG